MKRAAAFLSAAALVPLLFLVRRPQPVMVQAAAPVKHAFLIQFGLDGAPDVDWSGSISGPRLSISGWQFDPKLDHVDGMKWRCATRRQSYWDTPYEPVMQPTSTRAKVTGKGIRAEIETPGPDVVRVSTAQGEFSFDAGINVGDVPRAYLNGRVSVQAVPAAAALTRDADVEDYPSLVETREGTLWLAYQSYAVGGDQIYVRRLSRGTWSPPEPVAEGGGDYFRTAIAQDRTGKIWVVWSAQVDGNFDLYARAFDGKRWSAAQRLTTAEGSDIFHTMVADSAGNLFLVWQSARSGNFDIYLKTYDGKTWSPDVQVSSDLANDWEPALAAAPGGGVTIVWDTYANGNYDVVARTWREGQLSALIPIAGSGAFEARPSAQYDRTGRLWVAWDEGDFNWGKDYGYQIPESGRGLLSRRQVRVAVLDGGRTLEPARPIADAVPPDLRQVSQHPNLVLDGEGNPWVLFRARINLPQGYGRDAFRALWRLYGTTWRDGRWLPAIEFPGNGRIDLAATAVVRRDGGIAAAWASDGRVWPFGRPQNQDLYFTEILSGTHRFALELVAGNPRAETPSPSHAREPEDVARVRNHRVEAGGRTFRIVRGDLHRHTDLSWDGNRDGSLDDSYRYAMDAASFDYLGVCDHQGGESISYNWWRLQKAVDLYTIRDRFTPVYSYERSLSWPNGHRNVFFARRGRPVLEIPEAEARGVEGAGRLYRYLRSFGGVTSSHTTASGMGTDFRDHDEELEPVVELYQGYRNNFEALDAPRAPSRQESVKFTAGYVWSAWARGIRLGVQSSSDHVSTHISYAAFLVDRLDRDAILAAMKARRAYAATDNIMLDVRMGAHLMGEAFEAPSPPPLEASISGTAPIDRVEVIRNNRIVYTAAGIGRQMQFTYSDREALAGEAWYYIRVQQQDGQLAWSSPIWIRSR